MPESTHRPAAKEQGDLVSVPLESIPLNQPLPYPVYIKVADTFIFFRNEGDILTVQRATSLTEKKVDSVYIPKKSLKNHLISIERALMSSPPSTTDNAQNVSFHLRHVLHAYNQQIQETKAVDIGTYKKLKEWAHRLAIEVKNNSESSRSILRSYKDYSLYSSSHGVNVAIYSALIGIRLGLSMDEVKALTVAALIHDIGHLFLSNTLINKPGHLTGEETILMRRHPAQGAEFLTELGVTSEIAIAVLQHHERMDGSGYPKGIAGEKIHLFGRIIGICDVYDAMTSFRPYHPEPFAPEAAAEMMRHMVGKFDPMILKVSPFPAAAEGGGNVQAVVPSPEPSGTDLNLQKRTSIKN